MTPRIIITEGPDNCGKSTLAKAIANRFNFNYWHMTSGPGLQEHEAMSLYQMNAWKNAWANLNEGRGTVFDRFWPSDQVYGSILRDRPSIDFEEMMQMSKDFDALFVFCTRYNAVEHHRNNQDPDHPYDDEVYSRVNQGYEDLFSVMEKSLGSNRVISYQLDNFLGEERKGQLDAFLTGLTRL